ncbi:hypothetical protein MJT46_004093 [Ovis ammon polii x Ovis aries]|nr:hypothetical protein MJT46_004093 [Ovis ammon polii x Ovis aries]
MRLLQTALMINGQLVALKVISMNAEEGVPFTAIREASLLKGLKHANIVLLHDIIHTKETLTFVFEYVHTDLAQYMSQHPGGLHPHNVRLFMFQLLRGLAYIHHQHVLHRDLKPQNLLISHLGELKLADFGLARAKSIPSQTYSSEVVTLWYRPPDALLGATEYSSELDIWGAGCIFIEMFQGQPLFPGVSNILEQLEKIWEVLGVPTEDTWPGVSKLPNYNPEWFPLPKPQSLQNVFNRNEASGEILCLSHFSRLGRAPEAEDLASQMLKGFPRDRVSAQDALVHNYFSVLPAQLHQLPDVSSGNSSLMPTKAKGTLVQRGTAFPSNSSNIKAITSIQQLLPARQVTRVTQLSELVKDFPKMSINPFSHHNTTNGDSLFSVQVASLKAGRNILSFHQTQVYQSEEEDLGLQDELKNKRSYECVK